MEFRNTLIMSVMLVTGFVCLHFHEAHVMKENRAFRTLLMEAVIQKEINLRLHSFHLEKRYKEGSEVDDYLKGVDHDLMKLEKMIEDHDVLKLESTKRMVKAYNIRDNLFDSKHNVSLLAQFEVYDSIERQLRHMYLEEKMDRRQKRQDDIALVIKNKKLAYGINKEHNLEFDLLDSSMPENVEGFIVEVDEVPMKVTRFPLKLKSHPDQVVFRGTHKNKVTGEMRTMKELHRLNK